MYLISSAKMSRAKADLDRTRPYFNALQAEIKRIFRTVEDADSPYIYPDVLPTHPNGVFACLVITADKGLSLIHIYTFSLSPLWSTGARLRPRGRSGWAAYRRSQSRIPTTCCSRWHGNKESISSYSRATARNRWSTRASPSHHGRR